MLSVFTALIAACLADVDYTGYKLVRFGADPELASWLGSLEDAGYDFDETTGKRRILFDIWGEPSKTNPATDVLVAPDFYDSFLDILKAKGVDNVQILQNDIQDEIRREKWQLARSFRRKRKVGTVADFDVNEYHSYDEMVDLMQNLAREYPSIVQLLNITETFEKRRLYGLKITSQSQTFKPAIFVDAGIHAREWVAPAAALYMMKRLVTEYGKNPQITRSLEKFEWFIIPQANPDGYEYSRNTDRLWRKTRSKNTTVNRWCIGADANRNWGYRWGEAGANRQPCSNIYAGSHPFSEPEIAGLRDLITWQIPQLVVYVSLHSYGQLLLAPWGYTNEKTNNYQDQKSAARVAVAAMKRATGASYTYGTISELMYPASGTSIDYMQHKGVPYIYGVELRPLDLINGYAFSLPPKFIEPTGEEMLAALFAVGDYAIIHKRL